MSRGIMIAKSLQKELADILQNEVKTKLGMHSITHIDVANDIQHAKVFVSFFGGNAEKRFDNLQRAKGFIRSALARRITLKHVPELTFIFDRSLEEGDQMLQKIKSIQSLSLSDLENDS